MLTNNWYKILAASVVRDSGPDVFGVNYSGVNKRIEGNIFNYFAQFDCPSDYSGPHLRFPKSSIPNNSGGVIFGTGDTVATIEDYKLSGEIITNLDFITNVSANVTNDNYSVTATYTITNNNANEVTIREVGAIGKISGGSTIGTQYIGLLERTVLDTPVTIPAGGVGQVEHTITFNLPTAT